KWGHTLGGFVQQDQEWIAHESTGDGKHLLLAPAHERARTVLHFTQIGKKLVEIGRSPKRSFGPVWPYAGRLSAHLEVFGNREIGEDAAVLGDKAQPGS